MDHNKYYKVISLTEKKYIKQYKEFYSKPRLNLSLDVTYKQYQLKVVN